MCDHVKWNLSSSKNRRSSRGLVGSNWGAPRSPRVGIGGITGCDMVAVVRIDLGVCAGLGVVDGRVALKGEELLLLGPGRSEGGLICDPRAVVLVSNKFAEKGLGVPNSSGLK